MCSIRSAGNLEQGEDLLGVERDWIPGGHGAVWDNDCCTGP